MQKCFFLVSLLLSTVVCFGQKPVAQLPLTYIDTTFNLPSGVTWAAHTNSDLSNALKSSLPGDIIILDAGATYSGNFTLPVKSNPNNRWIYIVSSALASLPAPGTRVGVADAVNMPKIVATGVTAPLTLPPGANHYRLAGLEIYSASTQGCNLTAIPPVNCFSYQLVNAASTPGKPLVDSITVDRCYIHGSPTQDVQHAISANASNFAVVDSYISDIHQSTNDSQTIAAWWTPGPIKIVNNFLSATSEDVLFGGAGGLTNPWVPSDIEIRNNHFYKPLIWAQVGVTIPPKNQWVVKNNLELKSAQRVLVDSNILENVWVSGQTGFSIALTPRTNSSGLLAVVDDITISNNILLNVSSGFNALEYDDSCLPANGCTDPGEERRVIIYNNLIELGNTTQPGYTNGYNWGGLIFKGMQDMVVQHNTVVPPPNLGKCGTTWYFNATPPWTEPYSATHNVWILDNVGCREINGLRGWVGQFPYVITDYMSDPAPLNPRFTGNVFYAPPGDRVYSLPPYNYTSTVPFTYVNPGQGNYQLLSPNWTATSDGKIAGVDDSMLP